MVSLPEDIFQETYGKVKKLIVTKKLSPGQLVTEQRLSHTLKISDDSIPIVLSQLREESLLVGTFESGLTVRELSEQEISEMFDCRIALETMTVKLFTRNASQSKIDDLRNLLVPFEISSASIDFISLLLFESHVYSRRSRMFSLYRCLVYRCRLIVMRIWIGYAN